ncbi:MAG: diacylglycerol kinase [Candidatus Pacebacteria bacterium]|nr:diacylglycerol kinase [Candidatus Paceibacterota bacterium]
MGILKALSPAKACEAAKYGFEGIWFALTDSSFLRLIIFEILLATVLVWLLWPLTFIETMAVLPAFTLPLCTEVINVGLEELADKVEPEKDVMIKRVKDCAAGATLIANVYLTTTLVAVLVHRFL